jgi:hypothetical protein
MKKQKLAILALVWAIAVVTVSYALFALYEYYKPRTFYDNGVTDDEYITITNQTLEAKKFLEKYPNAVIQVDRSGRLAVDYWVGGHLDSEYLRLRIFIDWRNNKPEDMFVDNSGTYDRENILEYIEKVEFPN